ncbi:MAG: DUF4384 domain-containing protein, partial [Gemmatimonadales bacterium]
DYGDRAKVYVRSAGEGYHVVLRSDARGNVRVLSPVDPDDGQQIRGGKKYEVKGRGGREAFVVEDTLAQGTVVAAWSKTPFDFRRYQRNGHWDPGALADAADASDDPELRLLSLLDEMKGTSGHYEYDAATYVVYAQRYARAGLGNRYPYGWNGGFGYGAFGYSGYGGWGYDRWWGGPFYGNRVIFVPRSRGYWRHR